MPIVINLLMVLLVALCLLMLLIILMQRPKQEGLGAAFGGGVMDGMLGSGTTNFLQKGTVYLTVGYFVITMTLAVIQARTSEARSLLGKNLEVAPTAVAGEEPANDDAENNAVIPAPSIDDGEGDAPPEEVEGTGDETTEAGTAEGEEDEAADPEQDDTAEEVTEDSTSN